MTPTMKLRFVERKVYTDRPDEWAWRKILQQWWEVDFREAEMKKTGEWRDVEVEEE